MGHPTKSERMVGAITLAGAAVVAASVLMPYVYVGQSIFVNERTPFQFGPFSHFSSEGFEVLLGALLMALSGLRILGLIYRRRSPRGISLCLSCAFTGNALNHVWSTGGWSGPVHLAYGGIVGFVGVGIGATALVYYLATSESDENNDPLRPRPEAFRVSTVPCKASKYCHECGLRLVEGAEMCAVCGTVFVSKISQSDPQQLV